MDVCENCPKKDKEIADVDEDVDEQDYPELEIADGVKDMDEQGYADLETDDGVKNVDEQDYDDLELQNIPSLPLRLVMSSEDVEIKKKKEDKVLRREIVSYIESSDEERSKEENSDDDEKDYVVIKVADRNEDEENYADLETDRKLNMTFYHSIFKFFKNKQISKSQLSFLFLGLVFLVIIILLSKISQDLSSINETQKIQNEAILKLLN